MRDRLTYKIGKSHYLYATGYLKSDHSVKIQKRRKDDAGTTKTSGQKWRRACCTTRRTSVLPRPKETRIHEVQTYTIIWHHYLFKELTGTGWLISERRGFEPLVRLLVRFISNEVLSATQSSLHSYYSKMLRHGQDFRFIRSLQWYHTPCRTRTYDIRFWRPAFYQLN
jgi:hypothetical protein